MFILALRETGNPQFYISCAQLTYTNGRDASPATAGTPGYLSADDPSLTINIYYPIPTSYACLGPDLFVDAGNAASANSTCSNSANSTSFGSAAVSGATAASTSAAKAAVVLSATSVEGNTAIATPVAYIETSAVASPYQSTHVLDAS
ncbi:hypothetical protein FISHEDRAFT_68542 [Fistulina hepatica ATCC 64428]|uniref:lytic cellulose monooxygenase (C4-dehydrogenating) n=1 Tax=Fistulina hepatica ATCC 64428 TaxID=1128425 RepID=A0A0D7APJ9_9AGAR|nr:hypothetical protein FISHEDRAFT_68542 [Fistulina hepatica ATCC 64428]